MLTDEEYHRAIILEKWWRKKIGLPELTYPYSYKEYLDDKEKETSINQRTEIAVKESKS